MTDKFSRREFLRKAGFIGVGAYGLTLAGDDIIQKAQAQSRPEIAVASSGTPEAMVKKAIDAIGGIKKFVKPRNSVVIKPNLAWARTPEQAANTNPQVIKALIKLCEEAGAGRITVMDHTCDPSATAFRLSGAEDAVKGTKARLVSADREFMYEDIKIPRGKILKNDKCLKEVLEADVFINVPIAKVHGASTMTASMKNLMGVMYNRQAWHNSRDLEQCIADYSTAVKPNLIILDAIRVMLTRGPKGPGDTKDVGQVAAGVDPVAIDAYAATTLDKDATKIKHIAYAASLGIGEMDLKKVNVKRV